MDSKSRFRSKYGGDERREQLRKMFDMFDTDGSGHIDIGEMRAVLPKLGMNDPTTRRRLAAQFDFMDRDGSGEVSFDEFAAATIDASFKDFSCLADEMNCAQFGMDLYMLLAAYRRKKLLEDFESSLDDQGKNVTRKQFNRLVEVSKTAMFPFEMREGENEAKMLHSKYKKANRGMPWKRDKKGPKNKYQKFLKDIDQLPALSPSLCMQLVDANRAPVVGDQQSIASTIGNTLFSDDLTSDIGLLATMSSEMKRNVSLEEIESENRDFFNLPPIPDKRTSLSSNQSLADSSTVVSRYSTNFT
mmetsp:Transcript_11752/g.15328  ORF Transcript_11752/g.15328 Transcript_11752/m.15328 type:complete len:302 (-) Transcript_11752:70-975(-)